MRVVVLMAPGVLVSFGACADTDRSTIDGDYRRDSSESSSPSEPSTETYAEQPAGNTAAPDDPTANPSADPGAACQPPSTEPGLVCSPDDAAASRPSGSTPVMTGEAPREDTSRNAGGSASAPSGGNNGGDGNGGSGETAPDEGEQTPDDGSGTLDGNASPPEELPDLIIDGAYLAATIQQDVVDASADLCLFNEGCVTGDGLRRVVRFGTRSANVGTADVVVGQPVAGNPLWEYDACHEHFHFEGYASYDLVDATTGSVLPIGNKNGFCLRDLDVWTGSEQCGRYDCEYQGISVGCADVYTPDLDCQWIDITDVAPGSYELVVRINTEGLIQELSSDNNTASVSLQILPETVQIIPR